MLKHSLYAAAGLALIVASPACAGHHGKSYKEKDKTMAAEAVDIVDTAVAAGSFTTLVAAVQAAGLEGALRGDGPLTVFAPTDDAFAALPDGTVESLLLPENLEQLQGILTYHVVAGKVKSKDLAGKTLDAETLNGATVAVDGTDGVTVGGANVIQADIKASNGVIHVIDAVLLPPSE